MALRSRPAGGGFKPPHAGPWTQNSEEGSGRDRSMTWPRPSPFGVARWYSAVVTANAPVIPATPSARPNRARVGHGWWSASSTTTIFASPGGCAMGQRTEARAVAGPDRGVLPRCPHHGPARHRRRRLRAAGPRVGCRADGRATHPCSTCGLTRRCRRSRRTSPTTGGNPPPRRSSRAMASVRRDRQEQSGRTTSALARKTPFAFHHRGVGRRCHANTRRRMVTHEHRNR